MGNQISQDEYFRSRQEAVYRGRELQEHNDGESLMVKSLNPLGETFPFRCSCGVKHQFSYTQNEAGVYLLSLE